MKKLLTSILAAVALCFAATSCVTVTPGYGVLGTGAVTPGVSMKKKGEASARFLFGAIPMGNADYSVSKAAENGGIKKIATVDTKTVVFDGIIFVTKTTIVTGE